MATKKKTSKSPAKKPLREYLGQDPKYHSYKSRIVYSPSLYTEGRIERGSPIPFAHTSEWDLMPREAVRVHHIKLGDKLATKHILYDHDMNSIKRRDVRDHRVYVSTVPYQSLKQIERKTSHNVKEYLSDKLDLLKDSYYVYLDMRAKELAKAARHRRITRKNKSPLERR